MEPQQPITTPALTWAHLMQQAFGANAAILIAYALTAANYEFVFEQVGFMPLLTLRGFRASGKTAAALATQAPIGRAMLSLQGMLATELSGFISEAPGLPLVLDDFYKPSQPVLNRIKGIYHGTPFDSAGAIICTQDFEAHRQLVERSLVLYIDADDHSPESADALQQLLAQPFAFELPQLVHRELFRHMLSDNKKWLNRAYARAMEGRLPDSRLVDNAAVLLTVAEATMQWPDNKLEFAHMDLLLQLVDAMRRAI